MNKIIVCFNFVRVTGPGKGSNDLVQKEIFSFSKKKMLKRRHDKKQKVDEYFKRFFIESLLKVTV